MNVLYALVYLNNVSIWSIWDLLMGLFHGLLFTNSIETLFKYTSVNTKVM